MEHDWRGWVGTIGLVVLLLGSWVYFATDGFESDDDGTDAIEELDPIDSMAIEVGGDSPCADTLPIQGCGVLPEGSLDLNFTNATPPMFIEVSQASALDDGDAIQLLGTFTDIVNAAPQAVVLQCLDDGSPGIGDCNTEGAEQLLIRQRRFEVPGFAVARELRVSDGRVVDCGSTPCYLVVADVMGSKAIASIRLSFDD
ncbi:MAG: hypothetical protein AAGE98_19125 [Actinomycetota bacterium]